MNYTIGFFDLMTYTVTELFKIFERYWIAMKMHEWFFFMIFIICAILFIINPLISRFKMKK